MIGSSNFPPLSVTGPALTVKDQSPPFSSSFWNSARLRRCDCLSPFFQRISRWSVEHVTKPFSPKLMNIWNKDKEYSWGAAMEWNRSRPSRNIADSYLDSSWVTDQISCQLQRPHGGDFHDLLWLRSGLLVRPTESPHPKKPCERIRKQGVKYDV